MDERKNRIDGSAKTAAVIPAGGMGERMGGDRAKQFLELEERPLLAITLKTFQECPLIHGIFVVAPINDVEFCQREIVEAYDLTKVEQVVPGGARRQDSVRLGVEATGGRFKRIVIHDGVRPLVRPELIERTLSAAGRERAVITALPAKDTVKELDKDRRVLRTYDRRKVWIVQTPQVFRYDDILEAHRQAMEEGWDESTDDAVMLERMGIPVKVVEGFDDNIKVTTPHDLELVKYLMAKRGRQ